MASHHLGPKILRGGRRTFDAEGALKQFARCGERPSQNDYRPWPQIRTGVRKDAATYGASRLHWSESVDVERWIPAERLGVDLTLSLASGPMVLDAKWSRYPRTGS
jgi:hypothetical protein